MRISWDWSKSHWSQWKSGLTELNRKFSTDFSRLCITSGILLGWYRLHANALEACTDFILTHTLLWLIAILETAFEKYHNILRQTRESIIQNVGLECLKAQSWAPWAKFPLPAIRTCSEEDGQSQAQTLNLQGFWCPWHCQAAVECRDSQPDLKPCNVGNKHSLTVLA